MPYLDKLEAFLIIEIVYWKISKNQLTDSHLCLEKILLPLKAEMHVNGQVFWEGKLKRFFMRKLISYFMGLNDNQILICQWFVVFIIIIYFTECLRCLSQLHSKRQNSNRSIHGIQIFYPKISIYWVSWLCSYIPFCCYVPYLNHKNINRLH